jgi:hypothetical protein
MHDAFAPVATTRTAFRSPARLDLALLVEKSTLIIESATLQKTSGSAPREIERCRENDQRARGLGDVEETMLQRRKCGAGESDKRLCKGRHAD